MREEELLLENFDVEFRLLNFARRDRRCASHRKNTFVFGYNIDHLRYASGSMERGNVEIVVDISVKYSAAIRHAISINTNAIPTPARLFIKEFCHNTRRTWMPNRSAVWDAQNRISSTRQQQQQQHSSWSGYARLIAVRQTRRKPIPSLLIINLPRQDMRRQRRRRCIREASQHQNWVWSPNTYSWHPSPPHVKSTLGPTVWTRLAAPGPDRRCAMRGR